MTRLRYTLRTRASLTAEERARMLSLMRLCYDNVDGERFEADLDNKRDVIVLVDPTKGDDAGRIMGFSTVRIAEETLEGRRVDILFSGDTVIHPDAWGAKALQWGFLAYTLRHKLRHPGRPLYWLLLSKGYKTYLLLTNNFPTAFPRRPLVDARAPSSALVELRDRVAKAWWGDDYDAQREVLAFKEARDRVRSGVAALDRDTLAHPDVAYFVERNPGWSEGHELVCFAEIDFGLATRWIAKTVRRALAPSRRGRDALTAAPVSVRTREPRGGP